MHSKKVYDDKGKIWKTRNMFFLKAQILAAKRLLSKDCIFSSLLFKSKIFVIKRKAPKAHN